MRKQTKLVAVLSAAALLAMGASMTSFAKGWTEEDGEWVYLDSEGDRVTEEWKKSGNNYYWLDEDGVMATNQLVEDDDDTYYVGEDGVRVTDQWVSVDNEDDEQVDNKDVDVLWYYFGPTGRAYAKSDSSTKEFKVSTINGKKYMFDDEGRMVSGWTEYDNDWYYLGEENEGWAYTGWQYLELDDDVHTGDYDYDSAWFNFKSSGVMRTNDRAYIGGAYYGFDECGVMMTDWYTATDANNKILKASGATIFGYESGAQKTGWIYAYENEDMEGDQEWYYLVKGNRNSAFNHNGSAAGVNSNAVKYKEGNVVDSTKDNVAAKVINGKTYLFNSNGQMLTGVYVVNGENKITRAGGSGDLDTGIYYFNKSGGSVEGQMETGKIAVNYDGDTYNYYFKSTGEAYTMIIKDSVLYNGYGYREEAEDGNSYEVVNLSHLVADDVKLLDVGAVTVEGKNYTKGTVVVSSSGKVKKSGTVTIDGVKYEVNNYFVTKAYDKEDDNKTNLPALYEAAELKAATGNN